MYNITFQGGLDKRKRLTTYSTYKFLLFFVCDGQEKTLSQARSEGYVAHEGGGYSSSLVSRVPVVKLFTSRQGFGERKAFLSFYINLREKLKDINIKSFSPEAEFEFSALGRLMSTEEVGSLVGVETDSYLFFRKQSRLSVSELRKYITTTQAIDATGGAVRMLRF